MRLRCPRPIRNTGIEKKKTVRHYPFGMRSMNRVLASGEVYAVNEPRPCLRRGDGVEEAQARAKSMRQGSSAA